MFIRSALAAALAVGLASSAMAAAPPVDEIVEKANLVAYYQGDSGRAQIKMTITDASGRTRTREFTILRKDLKDGGDQYFYVHFESPADVRNTVYRVWKHIDRDDDRWLYLPNLDLVKRVAASDKRTSFVASHFVYEDVSGRRTTDDKHELIAAETTDKQFVLNNVPVDPRGVEFASYKLWINRETFMPEKAEYYDKDGKLYRTVQALKVEKIGKFWTVTRSRVDDLRTGGHTLSEFSKIQYDIRSLPDRVFTQERYLRRPARRYLR